MPKFVSKWECTFCNLVFDQKDEAIACEVACEKILEEKAMVVKWNKIFPQFHPNNTKYKKHCVDCGRKLLEWNDDGGDMHRNEPGTLKFKETYFKTLDGLRCPVCHAIFRSKLLFAMELYEAQEGGN